MIIIQFKISFIINRESLSNTDIFNKLSFINFKTNIAYQPLYKLDNSNNILQNAINYLLLYVYEKTDINNNDISQFYNTKQYLIKKMIIKYIVKSLTIQEHNY